MRIDVARASVAALAVGLGLTAALNARAADVQKPDSGKWQSNPPKVAEKNEDWGPLLDALSENDMNYGELAGGRAALKFFSDLPTKELAYRHIVHVIDLGYPYSALADFIPGDLEPSGNDSFAQSYRLYKGIVNLDKNLPKWADRYFERVDKEHFSKYLFFQANEAYRKGKLSDAVAQLKKALANVSTPEQLSLSKKEARTLARIYYEGGQFEKSVEVYRDFLLRLNPVAPTDWLEIAWAQYKLRRFDEALGSLYNLESKAASGASALEKYVLRALIYREYCSRPATDALIKSFNSEYGATIDAIKLGEQLSKFPQLAKIDDPETLEFREISSGVEELEKESARASALPSRLRPLAKFVYSSEIAYQKRRRKLFEEKALESMARRLVIMGESLRFLQFEVERERFDPERVFATPVAEASGPVVESGDASFRVHWKQWGDYWRDERPLYLGMVKSKCDR